MTRTANNRLQRVQRPGMPEPALAFACRWGGIWRA
jgi:hypothetical protein